MFWIIAIAVTILVIYIWSKNDEAKTKQYFAQKEEEYYTNVQKELQEAYTNPSDFLFDQKEMVDYQRYNWKTFKENELWRRHSTTIQASENFTDNAKRNAASAWFDYIYPQHAINQMTEYGLDREGIDRQIDSAKEARNNLFGVMEAYGFDLEAETKELEKEAKNKFKLKSKKKKV